VRDTAQPAGRRLHVGERRGKRTHERVGGS
jgi:hypothetical protein